MATEETDRSRGASWPPACLQQIEWQRQHPHPNSHKDDWHSHLAKTLGPAIKSVEFGANAISSILWNDETNGRRASHPDRVDTTPDLPYQSTLESGFDLNSQIDNQLLMYRAFDRTPDATDKGRHASIEGAYPYNVRMLMPSVHLGDDGLVPEKPLQYFRQLQVEATKHGREAAVGGEHWLYSYLIEGTGSECSAADVEMKNALITVLDEWFWFTLMQSDGPVRLAKLLASAVGNDSRSVADPVFNTGLIHYNPVFELGGLDRVQLDRVPTDIMQSIQSYAGGRPSAQGRTDDLRSVIDGLEQCGGVCKDMRRIVTFFYYAAAMVKGGRNRSDSISARYTGRSMAAILMPIKVRGSVWAVSLHVTLNDARGARHLQTWMANFFLMTNQFEIMSFILDRALWDNLERRISDLLAREIGRGATPLEGGFESFEAALGRVNEKLKGEQRLVPFVLPRFSVNWRAGAAHTSNSIRLFPESSSGTGYPTTESGDIVLDVQWDIEPNPFFVARQPWAGATSRSLEPAIRLGIAHGLRALAALRKEFLSSGQRHRLA